MLDACWWCVIRPPQTSGVIDQDYFRVFPHLITSGRGACKSYQAAASLHPRVFSFPPSGLRLILIWCKQMSRRWIIYTYNCLNSLMNIMTAYTEHKAGVAIAWDRVFHFSLSAGGDVLAGGHTPLTLIVHSTRVFRYLSHINIKMI